MPHQETRQRGGIPRLARWLVTAAASAAHREALLGDLEELHAITAAREGALTAWRCCWSQALRAAAAAFALRWRPHTIHAAAVPRAGRLDVFQLGNLVTLVTDVRRGVRSLLRTPTYTIVSVLTLALAIGANTLLFSIASPLVVRPLPVKDQDTLGWIMMSHAERQVTRGRSSVPDYLDWRNGLTSFSAIGAYGVRPATLLGHGDAERIQLARATANLPEIWGLHPTIGRVFEPGEDTPGRPLVGILSFRYWQSAFQGDARVLGTSYFVDGQPITIVGVMPQSIELGTLALIDIWAPLALDPNTRRDERWVLPTGRLAPGATIETANAEFQGLFASQQRDHGRVLDGWSARVATTKAALASEDTFVLLALLAVVVTFVLLIACANLANLVMARLVSRRLELDVRLALGATRWQVVRPWLVEGLLISLAGGAAGLALAYGGLRVINAIAFEAFFRQVTIDGYVLAFTAGISIVTPLLFALWPAMSAGRPTDGALRHGGRVGGGRAASLRRNLLVGTQVALALALLVVSALAVQSMFFVRRTDLGYNPRPLLVWEISLPADRYPDDGAVARFVTAGEAAARTGVDAAALTSAIPVLDADQPRPLSGTRHDGATPNDRPWASWYAVSPGFFDTLGLSILTGRGFSEDDRAGTEPVAVLGRMAADRYFDGVTEAIGRRVVIHDEARGERAVTIVGVVGDTRDNNLLRTSPQIYVPLGQWPVRALKGLARAETPLVAAPGIRTAMRQLDADVPISNVKPVTQILHEEMSSTTIVNGLFVSFAGVALALAAAGLFGVISCSVGQRRQEFGIRLALGASPSGVGRMVVGDGLRVALIGTVAGLVIAALLARLSASVLFGISPWDPATFAGVTLVVSGVAILASVSPALRAMRIDPARSLRSE